MRIRSLRGAGQAVHRTRGAFTLLEVLVVVAIIVMLAGVGGYYVLQRYEEAKVSKARMDCQSLAAACDTYKLNNDTYPGSIDALAQNQPNGGDPLVPADKLKDPWGKPYHLDSSGLKARVFTTSPKGVTIDNLAQK
jgi:general secretion pathway protein G